jgi:hypothetical protein
MDCAFILRVDKMGKSVNRYKIKEISIYLAIDPLATGMESDFFLPEYFCIIGYLH